MTAPSTTVICLDLDSANLEPSARADPAAWLAVALAAERSGCDLVTLADGPGTQAGAARIDALMLAAYLGARTSRVGVMAAADTTTSEPFLLATQVATVDFVSHGRAGWLIHVSGAAEAAVNLVGPRVPATGPDAWAEAAEYVEVVRQLWDSWEDGAEIRDVAGQRFIDRDRVHHIDFHGKHLSVKGPAISPRPPQGQPPVALAVAHPSDRSALELAAAQADVVFVGPGVDVDAVRRSAGERAAEMRLLADIPVSDAGREAVEWSRDRGCDGVRFVPQSVEEVHIALDRAAEFRVGDHPVEATLRGRLGLERPVNRHAVAEPTQGARR